MCKLVVALRIILPGFLLFTAVPCWADPDIEFDMDSFRQKTRKYSETITGIQTLGEDIAKEIVFLGAEQVARIPDDEMEEIVSGLTYMSRFEAGGISAAMSLGHIGPRAKCAIPVLLRMVKISEEEEKIYLFKSEMRSHKFYYSAVQKIEPGLLPLKDEVRSVILEFQRKNPECKTD